MKKSEWLRCPVCGNKTRLQIREDTELKNFQVIELNNQIIMKGGD